MENAGRQPDVDRELIAAELMREGATLWGVPRESESAVAPCRVHLFKSGLRVSEDGGRNRAALALACHLRQLLGYKETRILALLGQFNRRCSPPLSDRELAAVVRSALKPRAGGKPYEFGCAGFLDSPVCPGKAACLYCVTYGQRRPSTVPNSAYYQADAQFRESGWPNCLRKRAGTLYCWLTTLAMLRGFPPDATLYTTFAEIEDGTAIDRRRVRGLLEELARHGLIIVRFGLWRSDRERNPNGLAGHGTEIRKVLPLPSCPGADT